MSLQAIETALLDALTRGGIRAVEAFPSGSMKRLTRPVTAVALASADAGEAAFCQYLGQQWNETEQIWEELYGKQVELSFTLDIFSPKTEDYGAAGCRAVFDDIAGQMLTAAPSGLRVNAFSCGPVSFNKDMDAFHCRAEARCTAYLCAVSSDEDETLLDFELRGMMQ
ncbi:MAG: hypothetical protein IKD96_04065 [Oscillospiraceae bacterium]|nr:hypothetical protein [Oscillospiraceae bacterium]